MALARFNGAVTFSLRKCDMTAMPTCSNICQLQWGRNFFVTEMSYLCLISLMVLPCFNGAVTFSLRKSSPRAWGLIPIAGFNGAVTFSLRKSGYAKTAIRYSSKSFNGAVTFSLRKSANTAAEKIVVLSLQWGRNFFVTEISYHERNQFLLRWLQWGRNFFVTEIIRVIPRSQGYH